MPIVKIIFGGSAPQQTYCSTAFNRKNREVAAVGGGGGEAAEAVVGADPPVGLNVPAFEISRHGQ